MIRTLLLTAAGALHTGGSELIERFHAEPESRIWIDVQGESSARERALLEAFGCHPLAIIDAQKDNRHPPKIEAFETHTLIIYRGLAAFDPDLDYHPQQIPFFIGERYLISLHPGRAMSIDRMLGQNGGALLKKSPGHVALRLMYLSAGFYQESLTEFEARLSELEDTLVENGTDTLMKQVIGYRSRLLKMRRLFNYHQSITRSLLTAECDHLPHSNEDTEHAITDVHERFERLYSLTSMYYDICGDLIDGYMSLSSHRLNRTMQVLTVITAIFVPLSFLAGLYGMNFAVMPELGYRYGYFVLLGCMAAIALGLIWLFRRKRWL
ncbi:magnesium/cobalt transporter CorA [Halomonas cibimaris]|uniref:Magnesium/cobalt transporter CorA n=1 Tax=Halomonas cibimaris TaxID=657012 RepID=A0ABP7LPN7_9GAMM